MCTQGTRICRPRVDQEIGGLSMVSVLLTVDFLKTTAVSSPLPTRDAKEEDRKARENKFIFD